MEVQFNDQVKDGREHDVCLAWSAWTAHSTRSDTAGMLGSQNPWSRNSTTGEASMRWQSAALVNPHLQAVAEHSNLEMTTAW